MEFITNWITQIIGLNLETQKNILISVLIVIFLWAIRKLVLKVAFRRIEDSKIFYNWKKTSGYLTFFITVTILLIFWFRGLQSLATYLGLVSAGIAIALKDPIVNLAAWLFIVLRKPFNVGDRIQIGEHRGDVIDLRIFQFSLLEIGNWVDADQSTGRIIHVPNAKVFSETLANYNTGFDYIWNEIPVLITFESNWQKAKKLLQAIVDENSSRLSMSAEKKIKEASKKYLIYYSRLTPVVFTDVKDSGVLLTIRYICDPKLET